MAISAPLDSFYLVPVIALPDRTFPSARGPVLSTKKTSAFLTEYFACEWILFALDNVKIDEINIKQASRLAMKIAISNIKDLDGNKVSGDFLITDAEKVDVDIPQINLIHGDELSYVVSCASIIAKEYRDSMFVEYEKKYPNYNFIKNVGYGTKAHYKGIDENGVTPIHRVTFLKKYFEKKKEYES